MKNNELIAKFLLNEALKALQKKRIKEAKTNTDKIKDIDEPIYHIALSYLAEIVEMDMEKARNEANKAYELAAETGETVKIQIETLTNPLVITNKRVIIDRYADIVFRMKKYDEALTMYDILHLLYPGNEKYFARFVTCLKEREVRNPRATKFASKYIDFKKLIGTGTLIQYARLLKESGNESDARAVLESVLDATKNFDIAYELGNLYFSGKLETDVEKIKKVIKILDTSTDPVDLEMKATLFSKIGMHKEAVVQLIRGANIAYFAEDETDPKHFTSQRMFAKAAEIAMELKDKEAAKNIVERARRLIPSFKDQYGRALQIKFGNI